MTSWRDKQQSEAENASYLLLLVDFREVKVPIFYVAFSFGHLAFYLMGVK